MVPLLRRLHKMEVPINNLDQLLEDQVSKSYKDKLVKKVASKKHL